MSEMLSSVLILIGEKDDWRPAGACERPHARRQAHAPGRVRLTVYPAATHSFDFNAPPRRNEYGKYLAYDADATRDATQRVKGFFTRSSSEWEPRSLHNLLPLVEEILEQVDRCRISGGLSLENRSPHQGAVDRHWYEDSSATCSGFQHGLGHTAPARVKPIPG